MKKTIGCIGVGNMGQAIIQGLVQSNKIDRKSVYVTNHHMEKAINFAENLGICTCNSNLELAQKCDIVILGVKPNVIESVIKQIRESASQDTVYVSIAAGKSLAALENMFEKKVPIVRVMPNTPALVQCGMAGVCCNSLVSDEDLELVLSIFSSLGIAQIVPESLMDCVTAVSGSSPAYVYMMIEAMADAAVAQGMPRDKAYIFAAQSIKGAASMVLEAKEHPGVLKDRVCSPGGTTIEAVKVLEETGFRSSLMRAMDACERKSKLMGTK